MPKGTEKKSLQQAMSFLARGPQKEQPLKTETFEIITTLLQLHSTEHAVVTSHSPQAQAAWEAEASKLATLAREAPGLHPDQNAEKEG